MKINNASNPSPILYIGFGLSTATGTTEVKWEVVANEDADEAIHQGSELLRHDNNDDVDARLRKACVARLLSLYGAVMASGPLDLPDQISLGPYRDNIGNI